MEPFSMTTSKAPSSKGSASMSATCQVMPAQPLAAARSRMRVTTVGEASVETMLVSPEARYISAACGSARCQRERKRKVQHASAPRLLT
jgi:hypothetical protein